MKGENPRRVLALHVTTRGFAFCLFDGPGQLIDFGIKHVARGDKNKESLAVIEHLLIRYDPHTIAIEDVTEAGSKRLSRVRTLYRDIEKLADRGGIETYAYPWQMVFSVFKEGQPKTRHDLAVIISGMIPAIARRLPPKRKIWLPQDPRQALFDAAALGLTCYSISDS
jgi:hypothetical protein